MSSKNYATVLSWLSRHLASQSRKRRGQQLAQHRQKRSQQCRNGHVSTQQRDRGSNDYSEGEGEEVDGVVESDKLDLEVIRYCTMFVM